MTRVATTTLASVSRAIAAKHQRETAVAAEARCAAALEAAAIDTTLIEVLSFFNSYLFSLSLIEVASHSLLSESTVKELRSQREGER